MLSSPLIISCSTFVDEQYVRDNNIDIEKNHISGLTNEIFIEDKITNKTYSLYELQQKIANIEYCPVVVNYDLLYNAMEMEQRICRCHRQGQQSDVLVINLLSKENICKQV